jgi:predicted phage tail protein
MADQTCEPTKTPPSEYRQWLISAEQKAQDDFDKAVLSLSGGALGISFIFVKDIIGPGVIHDPAWILLAWLSWAFSSLAILSSFFASHLALRRAIKQCDDGSIYRQTPGGIFSSVTRNLNALGATLFVVGVCFMAAFIYSNLSVRDASNVRQETQHPTPKQTTVKAADPTTKPTTN